MKFTTDSVVRCAARIGTLSEFERLPNAVFETPLVLLYTKRGSIPHLTKDVFKMVTKEQHLLSVSLPSTIKMTENVKKFKSFGEFVSMNEYPFFLSIQDPTEYVESGTHKKSSISVWSRGGRCTVTPDKYMDLVETFQPDMYVTLCDGHTDKESSSKRIEKAVSISKVFLERCLERHKNSKILKSKGFLGAVEGGYNLKAREASIKYLIDKPVLGYVIDGLHRNGPKVADISFDQVKTTIEHSLNLLPVDKLRVSMGSWNPLMILDLVNIGVDVFDSSYPYLMTEESKALTFLCGNCSHDKFSVTTLLDKKHAEDFDPICRSCDCLTCCNHSKAYIHHLYQTKELLGLILVMIHNTHHYIKFFKEIRRHLKAGTFAEFQKEIQSRCLTDNL